MIEWIVTSSALILLVLFLRVLIKNRVNPRLRYALWLIVLLRLVIPVSLWESPASVMNPVAEQKIYQEIQRVPRYVRDRPDGWVEIGHESGYTSIPQERVKTGEPVQYGWPEQTEIPLPELKKQVNIRNAVLLAWLAGIAAAGLFLLVVNLKFGRTLEKKRRTLEQYRGRWVFVADGLSTPCLFGLFRPAIYLTPEVAEDETAREHVLAHEYAHFRQGDHIWAALRGVCLALHWYNPLVWLAAWMSRRDCELSCDEGAVRLLGEENRADYGRTLVGLVARRTTAKDLACCATTMTGGKSALKERIALLVKRPRTTVWMACIVAAACAVFAVCTFTGAAEAEEPEPDPPEPVRTEPEPADESVPESFALPEPADLPENLPTELMDLDRPLEEQGDWLLLAETPGLDIALYRSAADDQHVYLRVTNMSFQRFDRDLTGVELLPTMEVVEGEADITVQALYRRYEGTYFNGTSYEPGIVAEQVFYDWDDSARTWMEWTISTQPAQRLTEDLPALADLPTVFGISDPDAPMWWIAGLHEEDISLYWAQYEEQMYLRYGEHIQKIDEELECNWLPELYFDDLDQDGDRELLAHYTRAHGTGVYSNSIAVYEWDGQRWTGTTLDPSWIIENFNANRLYEFYEDGTAYISYGEQELLLDLSDLWARGYWDSVPDVCVLSEDQSYFRYEEGRMTLILGGEILDTGGHFLHGYCFEYDCPITYEYGYLHIWPTSLHSDFAADPEPLELTDAWREVLAQTWDECDKDYKNVYAVHDINGDGEKELIVRWMPEGAIGSAWGTSVYSANGKEQFHGHGEPTFYDNGIISVPWSHNQGAACAIYPYTLYQGKTSTNYYNGSLISTRYSDLGSARARSDDAPDFEEVAYADLDGDGMVYYIGEDAYTEEHPVDNAVYEAWRDRCLAGAQILPVCYYPLTEEIFS